jgi:hypothetical protein
MKHKKYHTVWTVLKYHTVWTVLKYHTVRTVLKYHTVWTVLKYHTVRTVLKYQTVRTVLKYHTVRTVLKYHTVRTVLKSNTTITERGKINNTHIHDRSLSWLGIDTSIKSGVVKLVLWAQISPSKWAILNDSYIIGVFAWLLLDFYNASSQKQLSLSRHIAPLWHIILIPSQPVIALSP